MNPTVAGSQLELHCEEKSLDVVNQVSIGVYSNSYEWTDFYVTKGSLRCAGCLGLSQNGNLVSKAWGTAA